MITCPKCKNSISIMQTMKHTWWTPLVCKKCNAKLHFDKKEWYKITLPILILTVLNFFVILWANQNIIIRFIILIVLIIAFLKFFIDLRSIKLTIKDENK